MREMKSGKAPGLDGMRIEIYKALNESETSVQELTNCLNNILKNGETVELNGTGELSGMSHPHPNSPSFSGTVFEDVDLLSY